jgi:aminoglycoside/choline kinase family phosphotransferase
MKPPSTPAPFSLSSWDRTRALTGDASARGYRRLWRNERTAILVEYPKAVRFQLERDLEVYAWCRDLGLRVPDLQAVDLAGGRAILEDLGADDAEIALEATRPEARPILLERMLEPLEQLAKVNPVDLPPWNPPLDGARMRWELAGFELWFIRHYRSREPSADLTHWLDDVATRAARHPTRVCHRDYHLNNLLIRDTGEIGVIDIQDILVGPDTYDAVSLVYERAATRLVGAHERRALFEEWADRTGAQTGWRQRAELVRIQRGLKVLGTFARFVVSGDQRYKPWLDELAATLAELLSCSGAPPDVTAFLLD